jgi:hypothetical protein
MQPDEKERRRFVIQMENETREASPPEKNNNGFSLGAVIAVALSAMMLTALALFAIMNHSPNQASIESSAANINANLAARPSPSAPIAVAPTPFAPMPQTTPFVQTTPPNFVAPPAPTPASTPAPTPNFPDDATLLANVNKVFFDDPELSSADIDVSVSRGKVTLRGKVNAPNLRARAEKLTKTVRGVQSVENKINVVEETSGWQVIASPNANDANVNASPSPKPTMKKP